MKDSAYKSVAIGYGSDEICILENGISRNGIIFESKDDILSGLREFVVSSASQQIEMLVERKRKAKIMLICTFLYAAFFTIFFLSYNIKNPVIYFFYGFLIGDLLNEISKYISVKINISKHVSVKKNDESRF